MVDSKNKLFDNIIDLRSRMDQPLSRTAAMSEINLSADGAAELSRDGAFPPIDFSLPSLSGENRPVALIIGFSFAMTIILAGIAFAMFKLLSFLVSG